MRFNTETLKAAETHAELARHHVEGCQARLAEFDGLDAAITETTVIALRSGNGRVIGDDHRQRIRERDDARADLDAAEAAQKTLAGDLNFARASADQATQAARRAAAAVLSIEAEALAEHHDALLSEAATIRERLAQFDRAVTGIGGTLPQPVLAVLRDPRNGVDLARNIGTGEWSEKLNALLTDPV